MSIYPTPLTEGLTWKALEAHYQKIPDQHLRMLFAEDPHRGGRFALEAAGVYLDIEPGLSLPFTKK